jgi:hypothetical protein
MRSETKSYLLKEYGSWSVLIAAFLAGIGASRTFFWTAVPLFLALGLLINSKQAFMRWLRRTEENRSLYIFLAQILVAAAGLLVIFRGDITRLLPLLVIPALYFASNKLAGEHFILTELLGFTLLSLAAVLVKFLLTEELDVRLFAGVALYFIAGVFKIKAFLFRKTSDRVLTVLYVLLALYLYSRLHLAVLILLPLIENIIAAATLYKVRLQTTGWIEVAKSVIFLTLFTAWF